MCNILENCMLNMHTQHLKKIYIFCLFKAKYSERRKISVFFLLSIIGIFTHCRTINDMFGIVRKFWVGNLLLLKNIYLKIRPFLPDPDPTSVKNKFWWRDRVKWPFISISTCKKTQTTCVARHVYNFYYIANFWDLTLTLTFSFLRDPLYSRSSLLRYLPALFASLSPLLSV